MDKDIIKVLGGKKDVINIADMSIVFDDCCKATTIKTVYDHSTFRDNSKAYIYVNAVINLAEEFINALEFFSEKLSSMNLKNPNLRASGAILFKDLTPLRENKYEVDKILLYIKNKKFSFIAKSEYY